MFIEAERLVLIVIIIIFWFKSHQRLQALEMDPLFDRFHLKASFRTEGLILETFSNLSKQWKGVNATDNKKSIVKKNYLFYFRCLSIWSTTPTSKYHKNESKFHYNEVCLSFNKSNKFTTFILLLTISCCCYSGSYSLFSFVSVQPPPITMEGNEILYHDSCYCDSSSSLFSIFHHPRCLFQPMEEDSQNLDWVGYINS